MFVPSVRAFRASLGLLARHCRHAFGRVAVWEPRSVVKSGFARTLGAGAARGQNVRVRTAVGVALILVVIVVCELALQRNRRTMALRRDLAARGKIALGKIIHAQPYKRTKRSPKVLYTKIEYPVRGKVYTLGYTFPLTDRDRLRKGTPIEVLFDPTDPSTAVVGDGEAPNISRQRQSIRTFEVAGVMILAVLTAIFAR